MLEYREIPNTNVIELTIDGGTSAEEFDAVIAKLTDAIARHGKINLLKHVRSMGLIPASRLWADLKFGFQNLRNIGRVAAVADPQWMSVFTKAANPFFSAELRFFGVDEIAAARDWLTEPADVSA
jgi:hypothetical protein